MTSDLDKDALGQFIKAQVLAEVAALRLGDRHAVESHVTELENHVDSIGNNLRNAYASKDREREVAHMEEIAELLKERDVLLLEDREVLRQQREKMEAEFQLRDAERQRLYSEKEAQRQREHQQHLSDLPRNVQTPEIGGSGELLQ